MLTPSGVVAVTSIDRAPSDGFGHSATTERGVRQRRVGADALSRPHSRRSAAGGADSVMPSTAAPVPVSKYRPSSLRSVTASSVPL